MVWYICEEEPVRARPRPPKNSWSDEGNMIAFSMGDTKTGVCESCGLPGWECLMCSLLGTSVIHCAKHNQTHFREEHVGTRQIGDGLTTIGAQRIVRGPIGKQGRRKKGK